MTTVTVDIEALPTLTPSIKAHVMENMKPPGNMSKPQTIQTWKDNPQNQMEHLKKTALNGLFGTLYCIGYAVDDNEPEVLFGGEIQMLEDFDKLTKLKGQIGRHKIVGHNIKGYDIPFISKQMMYLGMGPLFDFKSAPHHLPIFDTMVEFCAGQYSYYKLSDICLRFGIPVKTDLHGSDVFEAFLSGEHQRVYDYAIEDVRATRELYYRMHGDSRAVTKPLDTVQAIDVNLVQVQG